jgi:choline dehydrogenase-like flavoprotein
MDEAELLRLAQSPTDSPFDYVIVGSGAGGGPLAARLVLGGRRVLLIDAGEDPALAESKNAPPGEVYEVPGYHAAATEDHELSWQFSVRHFADTERQARDAKYDKLDPPHKRFLDPATHGGKGRGGIFYPRSSTLGGCTSHHAMIVAVPNDRDWDDIANLTGDESWRPNRMRGYFARLERCLYRGAYEAWLRRLLGGLYKLWQWLVLLFDPRAVLDEGGHGTKGWQPTSFIDPNLIEGIRARDRGFVMVLIRSALAVLHSDNRLIGLLKQALVRVRIVQHIDPNDLNTRRTSPEGVFLVPTGIESRPNAESGGLAGKRVGVREFVLKTRDEHPGRLVIRLRTHVTRVLFEARRPKDTPRAIGVEAAEGRHLYEASPLRGAEPAGRIRYFAKREVILCGGAFNTPQLLMLSGIGDATQLAEHSGCVLQGPNGPLSDELGSHRRIDLPGVGRNLQDRYEVSVISELDEEFATLEGASFAPGDETDPIRREWLRTRGGLYRTNGGTLAILRRSSALGVDDPEPDLFTFGVPAAFRGYYFGWSRELLRRTIAAEVKQRNLWSWVVLKAYTRNEAGTVTLRSENPFDQPEICFDSFNEKAEQRAKLLADRLAQVPEGQPVPEALAQEIEANRNVLADSERDLAALADAVAFMRQVNARNPRKFVREIQPGPELASGSKALEEWIRTQAWGHHASCTCRMGSDPWREDPAQLKDANAVLDSRFRVHGVRGLRVVDASVFPKIPGYFILTPILMISEKAADVLLAEPGDEVYAPAFRRKEAAAVRARRVKACRPEGCPGDETELPPRAVGLALSGGGIRSATFALGVLQALAARNRLRDVDFLSTVSGGGFIGSFLGRLFTRKLVRDSSDPVGRVQEMLLEGRSGPLWWLRTQANYLFATSSDLRQNLAAFFRNVFSVHLVVGTLLFASFVSLVLLSDRLPPSLARASVAMPGGPSEPESAAEERPAGCACCPVLVADCACCPAPETAEKDEPPAAEPFEISPWWWAPIAALIFGVLPALGAFWLSQRAGSYRPYPYPALFAWVVLLTGSLALLQMSSGLPYARWGLAVVLLTWIWQDVARWGAAPARALDAARRHLKRAAEPNDELRQKEAAFRQQIGNIVRNRLNRGLGEMIVIFVALAAFVLLDSLALLFAKEEPAAAVAAITVALAPGLPLLRYVGMAALRQISAGGEQGFSFIRAAKGLGIPLAILLLLALDVLAHRLVRDFPDEAPWVLFGAVVFCIAIGRGFSFLNLSSLRATYSARLSRTFLGASNAARIYGAANDEGKDVQATHPNDDLPHDQYHPEENGGPLHLINVCINETVDAASERETRERKGVPMCVTPHGVAVGRRYFAEWAPPDALPRWQKRRRRRSGLDADDELPAEQKRRTALKAIPNSSDPNAFHVLKTRTSESAEVEPLTLGAWTAISGAAFSTGIGRGTTLPLALFMGLLNVRLGYWWDSGILPRERPGRYPLTLWRRLKRFPAQALCVQSMLLAEWRARFRGPAEWFWYLSDGGHFEVTGLYELLRRRVPFMIVTDAGEDPKYQFGDLAQLTQQARIDFGAEIAWLGSEPGAELPDWIRGWFDATAIGPITTLGRESAHSVALAHVKYPGSDEESWILLLKPNLGGELSQDVRNYAKSNEAFPQDSTFDQVFDDNQWESYRALGQQIGLRVLRAEGGR